MSAVATTSAVSSGIDSSANWYALYTAPRHEKFVADQINRQGVDCFLPRSFYFLVTYSFRWH
jgi:hypothetical protein